MRFLREPLLHFLLIGAAIYALFGLLEGDRYNKGGTGSEIVVTAGRIDSLRNQFTRARQRPPTDQELDGLIRNFIREEVFYREAVAMGLDRDDTVVRRRLRQKLEFLLKVPLLAGAFYFFPCKGLAVGAAF